MNTSTRALLAGLALVLAAPAVPTAAQKAAPEQATALIAKAQAQAKKEDKAVFVIFHASWCGWCKKLDGALAKPEMDSILSKYFVTVHLDVQEAADKKNLENPGGEDYLNASGGQNKGLPFFYFSDHKGKMIVNSIRPPSGADKGGNVGCPYEAEEIAWWLVTLKKSAQKITDAELVTIRTAFEAMKKADGKGG